MFKRVLCGAGVAISFLGSVTALAVPADALDCKLEARNAGRKLLASTQMQFQAARVTAPPPMFPEFRETASKATIESTLPDGARVGFDIRYWHATNGVIAYQIGCAGGRFCEAPSVFGPSKCRIQFCGIPVGPIDPDSPYNPYALWRKVEIDDGIPQLDTTEFASVAAEWASSNNKSYFAKLECKHVGTYP